MWDIKAPISAVAGLLLDANFEFVIDDKNGLRRVDTPVSLPNEVKSTTTP